MPLDQGPQRLSGIIVPIWWILTFTVEWAGVEGNRGEGAQSRSNVFFLLV